jgi:putative sugar O-methyltransferase
VRTKRSITQLVIGSQRIKVLLFTIDFALRSYLQNRILMAWSKLHKLTILRVRLVKGWRTQINTDLSMECQEPEKLLISGMAPKFKNSRIDGPSSLKMLVKSKTPIAYPLEIVEPFVTTTEDGNFNFLANMSTEVNLETFRENPAYHYLDPGHRVHLKETEHWERLIEMGISSVEIEKDLETLATLSAADSKVKDGLVRRMDVIHYFFLRQIARLHSKEGQIQVVEIGGGYGGLARQAFLLDHVSISGYTIIDIPITLTLIQQYLKQELPPEKFKKITFIDATEYSFETKLPSNFDLGIATHSLSELDPEIVNTYLTHVISRCETFLLSMQRKFHLNNLDYDWLYRRFLDLYTQEQLVITEGSNVLNAVFNSRSRRARTQTPGFCF